MDWGIVATGIGQNLLQNKLRTSERAQAQRYASMMSNTAHARQMRDMRRAGLNPILSGKYGGASTPSVAQANVGVDTPQFMQQMSSAKQMQTETAIKKRTLDYLKSENLTMEQIQYTAKNVFGSKMLQTFEKALSGDVNQLEQPYRAFGDKIQEFLRKADDRSITHKQGMKIRDGKETKVLNISGDALQALIEEIAESGASIGLDVLTNLGKSIIGF